MEPQLSPIASPRNERSPGPLLPTNTSTDQGNATGDMSSSQPQPYPHLHAPKNVNSNTPHNTHSSPTLLSTPGARVNSNPQHRNGRGRGSGHIASVDQHATNLSLSNGRVGAPSLKVSSTSKPRSVAGSLAHSVRSGIYPDVAAIGEVSVNTAVKAVAIARSYLKLDDLDMMFQHVLAPGERLGMTMMIKPAPRKTDAQTSVITEKEETIKVSRTSDPGSVAGAISARAREGQRINVIAIGPACVALTVKSLVIARRYLIDDSLDFYCQPEFEGADVNGTRMSSICMRLLVFQV
eukprot:CFRG4749T1